MAASPTGSNPTGIPGGKGKGADFKLQGHTASVYGSDPNMKAQGQAGKEPRELRP